MSVSNAVNLGDGHVPTLVGVGEVGLHQAVAEGLNPSLGPVEAAGHALKVVKRLYFALPRYILPMDLGCPNS